MTCAVAGCLRPYYGRGLCNAHYQQWRRKKPLSEVKRVGLTIVERLWARVRKMPSGCWEWIGCRDGNGYGRIGEGKRGQTRLAHRVSWSLEYGHVPADRMVLHRCDNPPCVRPDHLFLGTQADNMRDCAEKGRNHRGTRHSAALLSAKMVRAMRRLRARGMSKYSIARRYGINYMVASNAIERITYRSVE